MSAGTKTGAIGISGELTIYTVAAWKNDLFAMFAFAEEIEVVLAKVTEFDTAGLQLLLVAKREAARTGKRLRLVEPSTPVTDVLTIANLTIDLDDAGVARTEEAVR